MEKRTMEIKTVDDGRILQPGRNCWRIEKVRRAAILIDAAAYFATLRIAAARARRRIIILGWDIDSRTRLVPDPSNDGFPDRLGPFLKALVEQCRELEIYILNWDFAMLYAIDRELAPFYTRTWQTHRRLHFHLDGRHPVGACHHQKVIVIDDRLAFVGGMDLAQARWDTPDHAPRSPHRFRSNGQPYPPVHDVQMVVDGDAAAALGELARERWRNATGHAIPSRPCSTADPWPPSLDPDFTDVAVAIARTVPRYNGTPEVAEVRQLYLDGIAAAERSIYLENQYLTSSMVGDAIESSLGRRQGPEIVVVSRLAGGGWLEESTMTVLRARMLRRLRAADHHGRLRIYYPDCAGLADECINVHSKLMVMDARLLRIGSANLANRSMGLDTECDLAIEATEPRIGKAITACRDRLLAEHLGVEPDRVEATIRREGSLIRAIESLRGNSHSLRPLAGEVPAEIDALLPEASVVDPERPIDPDRLMDELVPVEHRLAAGKRILLGLGLLVAIGGLAAAWHLGPLADWLDRDRLLAIARALRDAPATPILVLGVYLFAALAIMPISLVIFVTVIVFGPLVGFVYALCGALLGASLTFALGHVIGRTAVRRLAGRRLNALSHWLRRKGFPAMVAVRLIPVAPFTVISLVAGAARVRFRDFVLGTLFGMAPGTTAITIFSDRLAALLLRPTVTNAVLLICAAAVIAAAAFAMHRWLVRCQAEQPSYANHRS
jgi:phospholipase D1/2